MYLYLVPGTYWYHTAVRMIQYHKTSLVVPTHSKYHEDDNRTVTYSYPFFVFCFLHPDGRPNDRRIADSRRLDVVPLKLYKRAH